MEENKKSQTEVIGEEELDDITGGFFGNNNNCFFEPEVPTRRRIQNNRVYVKCKSNCFGGFNNCRCHGSGARCSDKWHEVERREGDTWVPSKRNERNHSDERKVIHGLDVPSSLNL